MRHLYILFLFVLLAACEHEPLLPEAGVPVRIIPSLDEAAPAGTRVVDVTWTANDPVGVSISSDATTFKEYKASAGTNVTLTPKDAANTLYYPVNNDEVTFTAFCPYKAPASNVVTYNTFTDQGTSAKMQAVDLVYHSGAKGRKSTAATPVNMTFQHKFSKVVITATRGAGVTNDLSTLAMTLTGMPTSITCNVSTGVLGAASGTTGIITPEHYDKATATISARAIIAPHAAIANRTITFAVGSLNYSYTIPNTLAFETGKTYAFNFTLTQTAPVLSGTTITNWSTGTIAWDGAGNSLTAPTEVIHYKEASTGNTIVIKTNHANNPGVSSTVSWLTGLSLSAASGSNPKTYTLTYTVAANTGADRAGNIEITVGTMKVVTTVTQKGTSYPATPVYGNTNCFIVAPGSTGISFTLSQPGRAGVSIPAGTPTVSIIWKDADCINPPEITGSGAGAVVTIKPKAVQGNALIAIHSSTTVYWSYHIWVSDINLSNTWTANGGGVNEKRTFMDRNLGATANTLSEAGRGLFYQWGRKDPFPATNISYTVPGSATTGTFPALTASGTTEATARQNPYRHYYNSSNGDWLTTQDSNRWNNNGNKTVNDPCPAGWRVPTSGSGTASPWYGLSNPGYTEGVGGGISWNIYGAFPAAGRRNASSGALSAVGSNGYYWSATVNSTNAYYLNFSSSSGTINPSNHLDRAYGYSVRCVQE